MKQRILLVVVFALIIVFFIIASAFFSPVSSWLSIGNVTSTFTSTIPITQAPTPTPPPTPTVIPTPTAIPTPTPIPLVNGSSAYLLDATSNRELLNVNSHARVPMWSTTKIMTALLTIEHLDPDYVVTIQQGELDEVPSSMSTALLKPDDKMSTRDLLYGLLLPSGSDAAVVLAHEVSGNTASFVALMNTRASQIGLTDTHYENPYGADEPGHYSSAADLVKLAHVAMRNALFAQIVSTQSHHVAADFFHYGYPWDNILNPFLQSYPGANGIKTGSNIAGDDWCMVFSAYRQGRLLIGAEMQAPSQRQIFIDAQNILDKGFAS